MQTLSDCDHLGENLNEQKEVRIGFAKWPSDFDPNTNFFVNRLRKYYRVTICDDPDYLFYSIFSGELPAGDYVKIFFTGENRRPNMHECDWAFGFEYSDDLTNPKHMRLPLYVLKADSLRTDGLHWKQDLIKDELVDVAEIKKQKTNFCAYVYWQERELRGKLFDLLSKYKRVDAPGRSRNNCASIENSDTAASRISNEWQQQKRDFLKNYKFTISFENTSYPGYTTEKIVDAMLAASIPIYWGNPLIHRDFNTKSLINYHDFEKEVRSKYPRFLFHDPIVGQWLDRRLIQPKVLELMVNRIKLIDSSDELYEQILNEPWFNENHPNEAFDEQRFEHRLRTIFD